MQMLRFLVGGLLFSPLRRPVQASRGLVPSSHSNSGSRAFTSTCPNPSNSMEKKEENPFHEMAREGVPRTDEPTDVAAPKKEEQDLPKLSAQEFRIYNRMAEHMDMFHENFRQSWNLLMGACTASKRPQGMSIRAFLSVGEQFCHHLTVHHTIEEQHIFPVLARKMPAFKKELQLLTQHKKIHQGLDKFEEYIGQCRSGEKELRLEEMKRVMETFGGVLWQHLDDEVKELRAENMRKYWSPAEMRSLPM
ncbi:hypothetical protein BTJ68_03506 [Hortaea werneckii EXF-2000]|uniref:Hemerythrin-like domain-containing protein n=2 Tax=Hortaea werneckii TaxID=91943 RepID=A0A1Z5TK67_HORWE|nr:hypothetical protein BTJ68_03506 [Hortaea werneckii EXF-2000]